MKTSSLKTTLALAATLALPAALSAESLTIYASGDTFIRSDNPTSTAGSGDFRLLVGETASVTANDFRALFNFDLSTLPANAIITSVAFRLRVQDNDTNSGTATLALNLHALTRAGPRAPPAGTTQPPAPRGPLPAAPSIPPCFPAPAFPPKAARPPPIPGTPPPPW